MPTSPTTAACAHVYIQVRAPSVSTNRQLLKAAGVIGVNIPGSTSCAADAAAPGRVVLLMYLKDSMTPQQAQAVARPWEFVKPPWLQDFLAQSAGRKNCFCLVRMHSNSSSNSPGASAGAAADDVVGMVDDGKLDRIAQLLQRQQEALQRLLLLQQEDDQSLQPLQQLLRGFITEEYLSGRSISNSAAAAAKAEAKKAGKPKAQQVSSPPAAAAPAAAPAAAGNTALPADPFASTSDEDSDADPSSSGSRTDPALDAVLASHRVQTGALLLQLLQWVLQGRPSVLHEHVLTDSSSEHTAWVAAAGATLQQLLADDMFDVLVWQHKPQVRGRYMIG